MTQHRDAASGLQWLDPASLELRRNGCRLELRTASGADWEAVRAVRAFPSRWPEGWVAFLAPDGRERGLLRDVAALPVAARALVREELERRYVVARIERILGVRTRAHLEEWQVVTPSGPRRFLAGELRDSVSQPRPGQLLITDTEGNLWEIPNRRALDPRSQRFLDQRL